MQQILAAPASYGFVPELTTTYCVSVSVPFELEMSM